MKIITKSNCVDWAKLIKIAQTEITVPCQYCSKPTNMTETKMCDRCWEIEKAILYNVESTSTAYSLYPDLAKKIRGLLKK